MWGKPCDWPAQWIDFFLLVVSCLAGSDLSNIDQIHIFSYSRDFDLSAAALLFLTEAHLVNRAECDALHICKTLCNKVMH